VVPLASVTFNDAVETLGRPANFGRHRRLGDGPSPSFALRYETAYSPNASPRSLEGLTNANPLIPQPLLKSSGLCLWPVKRASLPPPSLMTTTATPAPDRRGIKLAGARRAEADRKIRTAHDDEREQSIRRAKRNAESASSSSDAAAVSPPLRQRVAGLKRHVVLSDRGDVVVLQLVRISKKAAVRCNVRSSRSRQASC
jgi:hypothetical protein